MSLSESLDGLNKETPMKQKIIFIIAVVLAFMVCVA
jgi:hypothetical protein